VLYLGGLAAAVVALLAGTSGFGFGLLAAPVLLLAGFSLPFVVTVNLLTSVATRVSVAYRLRRDVDRRRVALLVLGSIPGLWVGARTLGSVDRHTVKLAVGIVVMAATAALAYAERHPPRAGGDRTPVVAGFLGGLLGTTTSLIGVPPALMLARRTLTTSAFFADMAVYQIVTAAIGLGVLALEGRFDGHGGRTFLLWLPGVIAGNLAGTTLGLRLSARAFRLSTLALAFVGGAVTVVTA
jgi:uncharacterized membrane protein YfcA